MSEAPDLRGRVWLGLSSVEGFEEASSIFSEDDNDLAYFVNGTQVCEMAGDEVGLRLTRKVISVHRSMLKADIRVDLRGSGSDWVVVQVAAPKDVDFVLELATLAAQAHRPPPGTPLKPPPIGPELARRRRFH